MTFNPGTILGILSIIAIIVLCIWLMQDNNGL